MLELEGGKWLALPPGFKTSVPPLPRELRHSAAVNAMIGRAERNAAAADGEGTQWSKDYADAVIRWATALMPIGPTDASDERDPAAALIAVARGEVVDSEIVRDLIGEGFVHATTTRLIVTDEGRAYLDAEVPVTRCISYY